MLKRATILAVSLGLTGCFNETSLAPEPKMSVLPSAVKSVLEGDCSSCHGIQESNYQAFVDDGRQSHFYYPVDVAGKITDESITKEKIFGADKVSMIEPAKYSNFLRVPMVKDYGGLAHKGLDIYFSPDDPNYMVLESWIDEEISKANVVPPAQSEALEYFEKEVVPVMERNGCYMSSCHSDLSFSDLKLKAPMPDGELTRDMLEYNRKAMLGLVTRFANLAGDFNQSRIITKNIPIDEGGVHQRGGNNMFFTGFDDPDVEILRNWMKKEQAELLKTLHMDGEKLTIDDLSGVEKGVVFIRGELHQPRKFFDLEKFYGGSNIFFVTKDGIEKQLTSYENAEIQSLDVSYDAKAVVFSMRKSANDGFRIYELSLDTNEIRQLSTAPHALQDGTVIHHVDPTYKTGHKDANNLSDADISFASNEAGNYVQSEQWALIGEADNTSTELVITDLDRHEKADTYTGRKIHFVSGANKGETRIIKEHKKNQLILDAPLPIKADLTTIYEIERSKPSYLPAYNIYTFSADNFEESLHRITWNSTQNRKPTMRTSGALFTTTLKNLGYQDDKPTFSGAIFRLEAGGWDFHPHGAERGRFPLHTDSRELPNGLEVRLAHDPRGLWSGGTVVMHDHALGVLTEPNNPNDLLLTTDEMTQKDEVTFSSLPRFIAEQVIVDKTTHYTGYSEAGAYRDPYPMPDGSIMVSFTDKPVDHLDPNSNPDWDLYKVVFDSSPHNNDRLNAGTFKRIQLAGSSVGKAEYNARPVVVRLQENRARAIHDQKFVANVDKALTNGFKQAPKGSHSEIEIYDVPMWFGILMNPAQVGERHLPDDVKYVRFLQVMPDKKSDLVSVEADDPYSTTNKIGLHKRKLIIAEAPIEADSSAYIQLPTNVGWTFQALDKDKRALFSFQREYFTQEGEKFTQAIPRSRFPTRCAGCHGALTGNPSDSFGEPDLYTAASNVMATYNSVEKKRRVPFGYGNTERDYVDIDFVRDVQPILDKNCVSCHAAEPLNLKGKKTEHYTVAYESLHQLKDPESGSFSEKKYINERESLSSQSMVIQLIEDGKHGKVKLSEEEMLTLTRWIDMGATFKGVFTDEK
ncbi:hypothetical protein OTK49_20735 [Vibrio coralliirubri]|uniref:HzsA-related protein n=1 Tax=Vibrio coralliirubri TaxID=1516159 RepID=UPI0022845F07|nr:hypothetical protein [Vibrio coralliirubri]MCY9864945.1 hypothetical protein [Vibrio coralliirubri]